MGNMEERFFEAASKDDSPSSEQSKDQTVHRPIRSKGANGGRSIRIIMLFLILITGVIFFATNLPNSKKQNSDDALIKLGREHVLRSLKAPATAKFSNESVSVYDGGTSGGISGIVDAQNGYGALIRQRYLVPWKRSSINSDWDLDSVIFYDW